MNGEAVILLGCVDAIAEPKSSYLARSFAPATRFHADANEMMDIQREPTVQRPDKRKPWNIALGSRCSLDVATRIIKLFHITEAEASKFVSAGISLRTSFLTWGRDQTAIRLSASTTMAITSRATANGFRCRRIASTNERDHTTTDSV